jgi:uncharacterized protein YkwD
MSVFTPAGPRSGGLADRSVLGVVAAGLVVAVLLVALVVTRGGSDETTLTGPLGANDAEGGSVAEEQLANRAVKPDDVNTFAGIGSLADDAETDAVAGAETPAAPSKDTPASIAPPTIATTVPSTALRATSPTTAPPTTAPPTTQPPTTAAPTTAPPTTAPPTTAPPTTAAPPLTAATAPPAPSGGSAEQQVLDLVNAERANAGCGPVSFNGQLNAAALGHSQDMSANGYFSHTGLDGSQPWDRAVAAGYSYQSIGENIAQGYPSASAVMTGWMNSSGHRANIVNCGFTEMGLGLVTQGNYWTQLFGRPR